MPVPSVNTVSVSRSISALFSWSSQRERNTILSQPFANAYEEAYVQIILKVVPSSAELCRAW